jgi:hypothetical protein
MVNGLLQANTTDFRGLLRNGSRLRVPEYQRDYAWTRDKLNSGQALSEFLNDFLAKRLLFIRVGVHERAKEIFETINSRGVDHGRT